MNQDKGIIINEDLFLTDIAEYATKDLEYINVPNAVGIATEYENNQKIYIIYLNNEIGHNFYNKTTNSFGKAVFFAREMYKDIKGYTDNITGVNTKINSR